MTDIERFKLLLESLNESKFYQDVIKFDTDDPSITDITDSMYSQFQIHLTEAEKIMTNPLYDLTDMVEPVSTHVNPPKTSPEREYFLNRLQHLRSLGYVVKRPDFTMTVIVPYTGQKSWPYYDMNADNNTKTKSKRTYKIKPGDNQSIKVLRQLLPNQHYNVLSYKKPGDLHFYWDCAIITTPNEFKGRYTND